MDNLATTPDASITLDEIVDGYILQHRMPDSAYLRVVQLGIRGLRLFHRDSTGFPQYANLTVLANGTAVLPVNAMNKIAVGVLNNRGELASLTYDPNLSLYDAESQTREQQTVQDTLINNEQAAIVWQELQGGLVPLLGYGQYGVGSLSSVGFYNIDWQQRIMVFNFCSTNISTVQFVYLGLPCENGNYLVHPFFQEALIAFIDWQDAVGSPKSNPGDRAQKKQLYDIQYQNARNAMQPFDPSDIYNQYRQTLRLSVKV